MRRGDALAAQSLLQGADVDARDPDGRTSLLLAARSSDTRVMRLLLAHGADPRAAARNGRTALNQTYGDPDSIRMLLGQGTDPNARTVTGWTALMLAALPAMPNRSA